MHRALKGLRMTEKAGEMIRDAKGEGEMPKTRRAKGMAELDADELEIILAYERDELVSVATPEEIARVRAAARATAVKDKRVNIRLSSGDLADIQARALQEGMPYQTLIASVLHKYVTGRLVERPGGGVARADASVGRQRGVWAS
jgi:predicted DNA binding CopG/RHH family protein